jgi:hypothetical protein
MQQVLNLSLCERNFTEQPTALKKLLDSFSLEAVAPVLMQLMEIDANLASMHAKVSPNMSEEDFWRNYFTRIRYLRKVSGIEGPDAMNEFTSIPEETIIHRFIESSSSASLADDREDIDSPPSAPTSEERLGAQRREADLKLQKEVREH